MWTRVLLKTHKDRIQASWVCVLSNLDSISSSRQIFATFRRAPWSGFDVDHTLAVLRTTVNNESACRIMKIFSAISRPGMIGFSRVVKGHVWHTWSTQRLALPEEARWIWRTNGAEMAVENQCRASASAWLQLNRSSWPWQTSFLRA